MQVQGYERRPTPNFEQGRRGETPLGIVVHTTEGSAEGAIAWFADDGSGVSAHYLVRLDGGVVQFVDEADTARHAGRIKDPTSSLATGDPNLHTIGIEFEDGGDPQAAERTARQYEAGAELIAEVAARWEIPLDREHVVGHREIFAGKACPGNLDVERLVAQARGTRIVCLTPARNAASDLTAFLESAAGFADAIVALDDGSTDETAELLKASPLVGRLLHNPRRESAAGWDDGENRRRLLSAARDLGPSWVVYVDADERLDAADAAALRGFVEDDALRSCAYGLRHYRMWGEDRCDPRFTHVYRLFAYEPGLELPGERLHFNPVPIHIPRQAWIRTTIRLKHFAAASEERHEVRLAKYREADPGGRFSTNFGHLAEARPELRVRWLKRPAGLPVLEPAAGPAAAPEFAEASQPADAAGPVSESAAPDRERPLIACLLPARNCADELEGWLESVRRFTDVVVALDDGSTDGTAELLEAEPLVRRLLRNPTREGYAGWDDAANRQRLIDAAGELEPAPRWLMQLDADERIDADDAIALREFLEVEAVPGDAYGFRVHRMVAEDAYDRAGLFAYRLFAWEPGLCLPSRRLHLVPVPERIPRSRWRPTTFRIQHLASLDEERRHQRFAKYGEADAEGEFQRDYSNLLEAPGPARPWQSRPPGFPALADPLETGEILDLEELQPGAPVLSAVVISRNDEDRIERAVRSVVEQRCTEPFEVIVVVSGEDRTAEIVREHFPEVVLLELDGVALPGRARNAGVAVARGEYVSFPGSHVELPPGSLEARLEAHDLGHSMVTGSLLNGTDTPAGWATYFLDHATSMPGRPSEVLRGPPAHCSYRRDLLLEVGGFPEDMRAGEDTVVNRELFERGHRAYRSSEIRLYHRSRCERPPALVSHHFGRGRAMGRILREDRRAGRIGRATLFRAWLRRYPRRRLERTAASVESYGDAETRERFAAVRRLVVAGTLAAWTGIWFELALGRALAALRRAGSAP